MNRATADNQSAQSEEEGLEPTKEWVKDLVDEIIAEEFVSPDLELHWLDEDDGDPETVLADRLKLGAVTLNEMRDRLGLDPYANPAADRAMVLTPTGYVPIEANVSGKGRSVDTSTKHELANQTRVIIKTYNPEEPRVPKHHEGGGEWTYDAASALQIFPDVLKPTTGSQTRYAQRRPRGGGAYNEGTPGEEARLEAARASSRYLTSIVRRADPTWQPRPSAISYPPTPEGEIARHEAEAAEAQNRLAELSGGGAPNREPGGHHWVPRAVFKYYAFPPETVKVFEGATSGRLNDPIVNSWSPEHFLYNRAVQSALDNYLRENMISPEEMTAFQAYEFIEQVLRSNDPIIRDFNARVFDQKFRFLRRDEGDDSGGSDDGDQRR
jgi:hypothetical protein